MHRVCTRIGEAYSDGFGWNDGIVKLNKMAGFNLFTTNLSNTSYDFDGFEPKEWMREDDFILNSQTPETYPCNAYLNGTCYLDGSLYSDSTEADLQNLTALLKQGEFKQAAELVRYWDGEFVVVFVTETNIFVVSDSFGRLPVYYSAGDDHFAVSRNISFIRSIANDSDVDQMQLAISLMFGTQLGETTLWKSIRKMPPHSILEIDRATKAVNVHSFFSLKTVNGSAKREDVQDEIRSLFLDTLERRVKFTQQPTLSLSGGLDSRLIAAGLEHLKAHVPLITYTRKDGQDYLDHASSQEITRRLEAKDRHEIIELGPPTIESARELLKIKQGFNFLSMSYIIPYYQLHRERGITTITGDGGGKYFVDLYPLKRLKFMKQLLNYLLVNNSFCDFETAAAIAKVDAKQLQSYVVNHLEDYPFDDFNDKYAYFLIREAGINWAFEGEDRNRHYAWSTSPFYHPKLIELCLSIPQRSKEYGALFKYLYQSFAGNLGEVSNPNWKQVVENEKEVRRIHDRQKLKNHIPRFIINYRKGLKISEFTFADELQDAKNKWSNDCLDLRQLKSKHTMSFYWQLYTLMKLFERS